jgi:hypothetical protein
MVWRTDTENGSTAPGSVVRGTTPPAESICMPMAG